MSHASSGRSAFDEMEDSRALVAWQSRMASRRARDRRVRVDVVTLIKRRGDRLELGGHFIADNGERSNDHNGDKAGNKPVFNCRCAGLIVDKALDDDFHIYLPKRKSIEVTMFRVAAVSRLTAVFRMNSILKILMNESRARYSE
jgi:hypothetical protein